MSFLPHVFDAHKKISSMAFVCKSLKHVTLLVCAVLLFSLPGTTASQGSTLHLDFKKGTLSADIDDTPLRAVLDAIKKQKGIRFQTKKGGDSLLNQEISVQFEELPMQDALGRILTGVNHCLVLSGDSVFSVMLYGKVKKQPYRRRRQIRQPRRRSKRR